MAHNTVIDLPDLDGVQDKRGEVRYGLSGLVPATVKSLAGHELEVVMLDVSRRGLGILVSEFDKSVGDILHLCIEGQDRIDVTVRWMRRPRLGDNAGLEGLTRVGLATEAPGEDLLHRLEPFACIDH